jgi:hypothetical protein
MSEDMRADPSDIQKRGEKNPPIWGSKNVRQSSPAPIYGGSRQRVIDPRKLACPAPMLMCYDQPKDEPKQKSAKSQHQPKGEVLSCASDILFPFRLLSCTRQTDVVEGQEIRIPQYSVNPKVQWEVEAESAKRAEASAVHLEEFQDACSPSEIMMMRSKAEGKGTAVAEEAYVSHNALHNFFVEHKPENIKNVDAILAHYAASPTELVTDLRKRYGLSPLDEKYNTPPSQFLLRRQKQDVAGFQQMIDRLSHGLFPQVDEVS